MTSLLAALIDVCDSDRVYCIDKRGAITTVTLAQYEAMDLSDPRLERVAWSRRQAELTSLRVRGIETGFETPRMEN